MNEKTLKLLIEFVALAAATAGAFMLFGPVALVGVGLGTLVALELIERQPRAKKLKPERKARSGGAAGVDRPAHYVTPGFRLTPEQGRPR